MIKKLVMNRVAHSVAGKYAAQYVGPNQILDAKLGWTLLRDKRVPMGKKALALALGAGATAALLAAELPLNALVALILPGIGFGLDAIMDSAEVVVGPVLFASLVLPHLAPKNVVQQIRAERYGTPVLVNPPSDSQRRR